MKNAKEVLTDVVNFLKGEEVELEKEEVTKVELAQMKLDDGVTIIEAESFEKDQSVVIVGEEENVPLPIGDYLLEDGSMLVVVEDGIISEIKEVEEEEEEVEAETEGDYVTRAEFNSLVEEIKGMITGLGTEEPTRTTKTTVVEKLEKEVAELSAEKTELEKEKVELQTKLDEKPDAEVIKHSPKDNKFTELSKADYSKLSNFEKLKYNEEVGKR